MNEQPNNPLDQRIRQALDTLPDTPPPGSAFNAARLWEQLRPELVVPPTVTPTGHFTAAPQRTQRRWWLAAVLLAGLLFGGGWWQWREAASVPVADQSTKRPAPANHSVVVTPNADPSAAIAASSQRRRGASHSEARRQTTHSAAPVVQATSLFAVSAADSTVSRALAERVLATALISEPSVPAPTYPAAPAAPRRSAATYPRQRFQVAHQNDLLTDDEWQRVQQPVTRQQTTEPFVRLGHGGRAEVDPTDATPALQLPFSRNPNK